MNERFDVVALLCQVDVLKRRVRALEELLEQAWRQVNQLEHQHQPDETGRLQAIIAAQHARIVELETMLGKR